MIFKLTVELVTLRRFCKSASVVLLEVLFFLVFLAKVSLNKLL